MAFSKKSGFSELINESHLISFFIRVIVTDNIAVNQMPRFRNSSAVHRQFLQLAVFDGNQLEMFLNKAVHTPVLKYLNWDYGITYAVHASTCTAVQKSFAKRNRAKGDALLLLLNHKWILLL